MPRKLKLDIPGEDWRLSAEDLRQQGLDDVFGPGTPGRLVVDVGFGRGEFLMELAAKEPDAAFLGIEVSRKRVLKMARRLARTDLENVRLVEATAESVIDGLGEASVACFWINFPDPWPKKRHHRRRLLQPAFAHRLALRLAPGGVLQVATDHEGYAEQVDAVLSAEPLLENLFAPAPFVREVHDRPTTAYELEWRAEGRSFHFFSYRRAADGG